METKKITVTFTEELLGTAPANPDIYEEFIAGKRPAVTDGSDEAESLPDVNEEVAKNTTVFHRTPAGGPGIYDYQVKGFMKDACSMLRRLPSSESKALKAYKKIIDGLIFVTPRLISLNLPGGAEVGYCVRPLRAATMQGERISLARSETVPADTTMTFEVTVLDGTAHWNAVEEWLEYGKVRGLGQWRNSGKGRFEATIVTGE